MGNVIITRAKRTRGEDVISDGARISDTGTDAVGGVGAALGGGGGIGMQWLGQEPAVQSRSEAGDGIGSSRAAVGVADEMPVGGWIGGSEVVVSVGTLY